MSLKLLIIAILANVILVSSSESCIQCKKNEIYSDCINGGCDPRNCTQLGNPVPYVKISPENCIEGCICRDGYLRGDDGKCRKKEQCPTCGGDPNAMSGCGFFRNRCSNRDLCNREKPRECPEKCKKNGCECKPGFIYDDNTLKCVCPKDCTPTCKKNEVYSDCINGECDARNCTQLGFPVPCKKIDPAACIKGCICKPNYLRADNGTCIPKTECPSCGGDENAKSGCGVFCNQCKGAVPCPRICKLNSCDCKDGFVYDPNVKKCVLKKDCTPTCKLHEVYSDCINGGYDARNCTQLGFPVPCKKMDPAACIKGCICEPDYLRADNGTCIPKTECPSCGGDKNAKSGCGVFCNQCKGAIPCPRICKPNSCDCKDGFVYDPNVEKCVLKKDCTPTCKLHEVYSDCINGVCDARNCSQLGFPVPCKKMDHAACIKGCICEPDYLRADNGTCIPKVECPSCGGDENARSGCGGFCTQCRGNVICPRFCKPNSCDCKPGFVYDPNVKKCVLKKDCTPTCKVHEVYSDCINGGCDARNCLQLGFPVPCKKLNPAACIKGCICEPDYLRADNGTCIPKIECPSCGNDRNATSGCGGFCNARCSGPIACPKICKINACDCRDGYVYDDNRNICVLPQDCSCKNNEVYSGCINGYCGYRRCSELGGPILCVDPPPDGCVGGCVCDNGFLRDENNICVPESECPCGGDANATTGCGIFFKRCSNYNDPDPIYPIPVACRVGGCECRANYILDDVINKCVLPEDCSTPICKANEKFSNCSNQCVAKTCSDVGKPLNCTQVKDEDCIKGCTCISGYVRSDNGTCIPEEQCPCKENEVYSGCINGYCGYRRCSELGGPILCVDPPPNGCKGGCVCADGYLRDENNVCVLKSECRPNCKENEEYSNCTNRGCFARTCSQLGKKLNCSQVSDEDCIKGCQCISGYIKDDNGNCIPVKQCPSCNDDPNAELGCGVFKDRCSNRFNTTKPRLIGCILNGCQCREGFIYDDNTKKCVRPEQCTPTCQKNEEFSTCFNGVCRLQDCSQYGQPMPFCKKFDIELCKPGCLCKLKYLRNDAKQCVPQEECPASKCTKANEQYEVCPKKCPYRTCGVDDNLIDCPMRQPEVGDEDCPPPACRCKPQFFRDDKGECVPWDKCPTCPNPNEEYNPCFAPCWSDRCDFDPTVVKCRLPELGDPECFAGCRCKPGYFRNDDGVCVTRDQCPCGGDPNAEPGCGAFCDRCSNYKFEGPIACDNCKLDGCDCRKGYIFDDNTKKCVLPENCSPTCKKNEEFSTCANQVCRLQNCSQYGQPQPFCPRYNETNCKPGCICMNKYLKNKKGICIPQEECPEAKIKTTTVPIRCTDD